MRLKILRVIAVIAVMATFLVVAPPEFAVADSTIDIVALGDSYTAGTGALDYENRECYRSDNAYVHVLARKLASAGFNTSSKNFACHGALTGDIPGQIESAGSNLSDADIVVMTIGGNDADFQKLVKHCVSFYRYAAFCHDNVNEINTDLDSIVANVGKSVIQIANAAPNAEIVLVGYPYLVEACHSDFNIFRSLQSGADARYQLLVNSIDRVPYITAGRIHYASMLTAFASGGVCGDGPQLIRGSIDTPSISEWWHPNVEGHERIAATLFAARSQFGITKSPATTTTTKPENPAPSGNYVYSNLPLACGTTVAKATTYGTYTLGGTTFSHGEAVDFPVASGTKIVAPASGRARVLWDGNGYGRFIDIVDDSGLVHRMAHMRKSVKIADGAYVRQGQLVGLVGATGATTGPHLHYEQRRGSRQVKLDLDGPALVWSKPVNSGGDIHTLHPLKSTNCANAVAKDEVKVHLAPGGQIREIRPNGKTKTLVGGISTPRFRVECDLNGDRLDEMYSVEYRSSTWYVMQAKFPTIAGRSWREFKKFGKKTVKGLSCGDVNGNGKDELKVHLAPGGVIRKITRSGSKQLVTGISRPLFREECDVDGDGRDEMISLEKKGKLEYRLMIAEFNNSLALKSWRRYVKDRVLKGRNITEMSCGDRDANGQEEVKLFFKDKSGIFRIGHKPRLADRKPWKLWGGLTTPRFMTECDADDDGIAELYSVEYRGGKWYVMRGIWGKSGSLKSWKQYSVDFDGKAIKGLSCGNRNGS